MPAIFKRSLRAKVTISIVLPLILILGIFTVVQHTRHRRAIMDDLASLAAYSGQMIKSSLRHAMLESDFDEVQGILNTISENEDIQTIYLLDTSGEVIFAPNNDGVGMRLDNTDDNCIPCHNQSVNQRPDSIIISDASGEHMFRSMHTIPNAPECTACHDPNQRLLGLLLTDISMAPVEASLAADLRENLAWGALAVVVTVLTINLILSKMVLQRLRQFAPAIDSLRQGALPESIPDHQPDEIGQLAQAINTMAAQIELRNTENRQLSEGLRIKNRQRSQLLKGLITAQEDERKRVARELHDELGQFLSGLALHAEAVARLIPENPERAITQVHTMHHLTSETTQRMYDLILDLRPSVLDDIGLPAALQAYAQRLLAPNGLKFVLQTEDLTRRLPAEIETTVYRIFQEALCNVTRHAHAQQVTIHLAARANTFYGSVSDDGRGFDLDSVIADGTAPQGLGLLGMRERAKQCGGKLNIHSQPGSGTQVTIELSLGEDEAHV